METIETLFANPKVMVISADVNEIVAQADGVLTQFTAALLATKVVASHVLAREEGRWTPMTSEQKTPFDALFFTEFDGEALSSIRKRTP